MLGSLRVLHLSGMAEPVVVEQFFRNCLIHVNSEIFLVTFSKNISDKLGEVGYHGELEKLA